MATPLMGSRTDIQGISKKGVVEIQQALKNYINSCNSATRIASSTSKIQNAVKGTNIEANVKLLGTNLTKHIQNLVGELNAFDSKLNRLYANYAKQDSSSSAVGNLAKKFKS